MVFDPVPSVCAAAAACVPLSRHLPRAAIEWPTHPAEAVKRKDAGFRLLVYPRAYIWRERRAVRAMREGAGLAFIHCLSDRAAASGQLLGPDVGLQDLTP